MMEPTLLDGGRILFGFCLMLSWANDTWHWVSPDEMPYSYGMAARRAPFPMKRLVPALLASVVMASLVFAFVIRWNQLWVAAAILAIMFGIRQLEVRTWDAPIVVKLGRYVPSAACLLAYLTVQLVVATDDPALAERYGWEGACGVMGASITVAGLEKFLRSGTAWFGHRGLGLMLAERTVLGPKPLRQLRAWIVASPALTATASVVGNVGEVFGFIFWFPSIRWFAGPFLVGMLGTIVLLLGYVEFEWLLVFVALTLMTF